jgi:hypothetical protein
MAKAPAWLGFSDATEELLNRQRQATGTWKPGDPIVA